MTLLFSLYNGFLAHLFLTGIVERHPPKSARVVRGKNSSDKCQGVDSKKIIDRIYVNPSQHHHLFLLAVEGKYSLPLNQFFPINTIEQTVRLFFCWFFSTVCVFYDHDGPEIPQGWDSLIDHEHNLISNGLLDILIWILIKPLQPPPRENDGASEVNSSEKQMKRPHG